MKLTSLLEALFVLPLSLIAIPALGLLFIVKAIRSNRRKGNVVQLGAASTMRRDAI